MLKTRRWPTMIEDQPETTDGLPSVSYRLGVPGTRVLVSAEYEYAYETLLRMISASLANDEGLEDFFHSEATLHAGPVRSLVDEGQFTDRPMTSYSVDYSISRQAIVDGDVEAEMFSLHSIARSKLEQWAPDAFKALFEHAAAKGELTLETLEQNLDQFFDGLSKMNIDFDDKGNPQLTFTTAPEGAKLLKQMLQLSATQPRFNELIERKRLDFLARKRSRRLS